MTQLESEHARPSPAGDPQLSRLQRSGIELLMRLTAERAETEETLTREIKADLAVTDRHLNEKQTSIEQAHQQAKRDEQERYETLRSDVSNAYALQHRETSREYDGERFRLNERADHDETAAKKGLEEARWTAETVYEAKSPQPGAAFKKAARMLKSRGSALKSTAEQAKAQLAKFPFLLRPPQRTNVSAPDAEEPDARVVDGDEGGIPDSQPQLERLMARCDDLAARLRRAPAARAFEGLRPYLIFALPFSIAATWFGWRTQWQFNDFTQLPLLAGIAGGVAIILLIALWALARKQLKDRYIPLAVSIEEAGRVRERCLQEAADRRAAAEAALIAQRDRDFAKGEKKYQPQLARVAEVRSRILKQLDEKFGSQLQEIETASERELAEIDADHESRIAKIESNHREQVEALETEVRTRREQIQAQHADAWNALESKWKSGVIEAHEALRPARELIDDRFPSWRDDIWHIWKPPQTFAPAVPFGSLLVDVANFPGGMPHDSRLLDDLPPLKFTTPALLDFPWSTSLLVETVEEGRSTAVATLQNVMLRLLTSFPPGKVRFTIIDPVGLGQNFAAFMHLADYEEAFVSDRIWTETRHIEQRLLDLTEHMENVIQKYLRSDFETITDYNAHAGEIAEPFRFLVIANFPVNFSDQAARRLVSIVDSGRRCGVYTLVSMDSRLQMPQGFQPDDLRRGSGVHLVAQNDGTVRWSDDILGKLPLTLEAPPDADFLTQTLHVVGESAKDSTRVEVPFEHVVPEDDKRWTFTSDRDVIVPLGRAGATKLQSMSLGRGMAQHVLIAGKTGSGKSTLLHVLVTNLALRYRPDEVEFYLVDFKKGVEFKTYATHNLPHARAVAIESDREFGLSVLQRVDAELKRRGEIFRKLGVQDLAGYRDLTASRNGSSPDLERIPRTLLIIDEFQEFFVEDDRISQESALLLDRLVRQGRAFGIHVLLGSQTLGGAYSLARATIGQMAVRIALQCSEQDAMLIMGDDNTAPRLLSRPGEAIYNDQGGLVEGNNPFQIVWLPDKTREHYLAAVERLVEQTGYQPPEAQIVFEGNVPADINRNQPIRRALENARTPDLPKSPRIWLGDAIAIKDPTSALFRRQSGTNLLIVGQREESALAMHSLGLIALAAQTPVDTSRFYIFDSTPEDSPNAHLLEDVANRLPHDIRIVSWPEVEQALAEIGAELESRQQSNRTDAPPLFAFIFGAQRFRQIRHSEDYGFSMTDTDKPKTADKHLAEVLRDGPPYGMHTIVWCDNSNNLSRTFDRTTLREFDQRIMFQMSATDSSTLIDTPIASTLGENRALFFSEDLGILEKFRPYALPDAKWLAKVEKAWGG